MKIGITCYPTYGGSGVIAAELGLAMARRGHEVHFISYASPIRLQEFQENIHYHEVEVSNYPLFKFPPYDIALASRMAEVIRDVNLDILHVHYAIPHAVCANLAMQMVPGAKTKVITTLHGTDITLVGAERAYFGITKYAIEQSDRVTAVSKYLRDETYKLFGDGKQVDVIYNFVDTDKFAHRFCPIVRARFAAEHESIVMHVSNMRPVKRVRDVVHIFHEILKEVPAKLILVGEGPERKKCEELAQNLGIADKVCFLGNQQGIPDLLCAADLFLLPSEFETFGLAAAEAMSCGTPVLITKIGGTAELVEDGQCGFLFDVGDIQGVAAKGIELLQNDELRSKVSKQARHCVETSFSLPKITDEYEQYYEDVIRA